MKIITFAVPCYNSAAYMERCIESLLPCGSYAEIIIVDDGSSDGTGKIADGYAACYPDIVRAVHQENGGHGEAVNTGLANASGLYYKVVDSDDWLNVPAMLKVMETFRSLMSRGITPDMMVCNYVYEKLNEGIRHTIHYRNILPADKVFGWDDMGFFPPWKFLLMHSVIYRTALLRDCGLKLPGHTFYVDNIFVYQPLPYVKTIYYLDVDLYRYFIGREDQSVNEDVMVKRVDQQLRVTHIMIQCHRLPGDIKSRKLSSYMLNYLSMMMAIPSVFLLISGTKENMKKRRKLWSFLKDYDPALYRRMRYRVFGAVTRLPGRPGHKVTVRLYRIARKVYKFN